MRWGVVKRGESTILAVLAVADAAVLMPVPPLHLSFINLSRGCGRGSRRVVAILLHLESRDLHAAVKASGWQNTLGSSRSQQHLSARRHRRQESCRTWV